MIGIHINLLTIQRDRPPPANPTEEERRYFEELAVWLKEETGYQWIQGTKPQTLAYGLTDSPAGLAGLDRGEIPHAGRDCGGDPESVDQPRSSAGEYFAVLVYRGDRLLVLAVLCAGFTAMADPQRRHGRCADRLLRVPEGDHPRRPAPSRSKCIPTFSAGRRCHEGGHFAAMEQPEALAAEIQAFFRPLR